MNAEERGREEAEERRARGMDYDTLEHEARQDEERQREERGKPFGHKLERITDSEREQWRYKALECSSGTRCPERSARVPAWLPVGYTDGDSQAILAGLPTLWAHYKYVSAIGGKVTPKTIALCETCALHFGVANSVRVPPADEPRGDEDLPF